MRTAFWASDFRPPTSDLRPPTSDLRPPTPDLETPPSNGQISRRKINHGNDLWLCIYRPG